MAYKHDVEVGGRTFALTATIHRGSGGSYWEPPEPDEVEVTAIHEGDVRVDPDEFHALLAESGFAADAWWKRVDSAILDDANNAYAAAMENCEGER